MIDMEHIEKDIMDFGGLGVKGRAQESKPVEVEPTLVANMERLVELAKDSMLSQDFLNQAEAYTSFIAGKMNLSKNEAVIFSLAVEMNNCGFVTLDRFCRYLRCSNLRLMGMKKVLDGLIDKGFLKHAIRNSPFGDDSTGYTVPKACLEAIMDNEAYTPAPITGLDMDGLFEHIGEIFDGSGEMDDIIDQVGLLIEKNPDLHFCQKVEKALFNYLPRRELFLFYLFCHQLVNEGMDIVCVNDFRGYFPRRRDYNALRGDLANNQNLLLQKSIIEAVPESGMFGSTYRLTSCVKYDYFKGLNLADMQAKKASDLIEWSNFAEKKLYYNPEEDQLIGQIRDLLQEDKFKSVQQRLEASGMRKGFACLFYGAPGTGKTETVNQLARATGRDVMVVDVSQIKDKYVGESEKNIKEAFDRYRAHVKNQDKAPILLFNEADAVLGIRMVGAQRSVDKMNNAVQNIILQEMENLEGIMIATTNLTQNLDSAFERRFIYKVEFNKPSVDAREAIWKSMIPTMEDTLAHRLAEEFDLSGGQIENIARKRAVDFVLNGSEPPEEKYIEYCEQEGIKSRHVHKKVGFC